VATLDEVRGTNARIEGVRECDRSNRYKLGGKEKMKKKVGGILFAVTLMLVGSAVSYADIIVTVPGNSSNTENITFVNNDTGVHLTGTSHPSGFQLDVEGSSTLEATGNTVAGQGGTNQSFFVIEPLVSGQSFTKLRFNLQTAADGQVSFNTATGTIVGPTTFNVSGGNSGNVFAFEATNGQTLNSLTISPVNGLGLVNLKNINAGFGIPVEVVPEPGTIGMLAGGLGMLLIGIRRKRG
jgi:hypothetical protein